MDPIISDTQNLQNDKPRGLNPFVKAISLLLIVGISYWAGMQTGKKGFDFEPKSFKVINQADQPQTVDYNLLWEAIDKVNQNYIEKPVNPQKTLYGAISGAVSAAGDPYTEFFPPKELQSFKTDLKGSFDGIGAEIGKQNGLIVIVAPLDESPAKKAGILAKDIVYKVDGEITADWSVEQAVEKIRGPKGTTVTLSIIREGRTQPFDVSITRQKIEVKSVKWSLKEIEKDGVREKIGIISVSRFGDDTKNLFNQAVNEILRQNVSGIILDLRNNPGGYLHTSVELASIWLERGEIVVSEVKSDGTEEKYYAEGGSRLSGIKTAALINGGSASASEILAGALKDHNAATLIGEKSFGKGSVQELFDLKGGSAVKITIAKWVTPGGKNLNKEGLTPDVEVKLTEENISKGEDPQMEEAVKQLTIDN